MYDDLLARAERLERFAQLDPGNRALRLDLARTYHLAGQHEAALGALDAAAGAEGQERPVPLRGELLLALGRWQEAIAFYREASAQEPSSAPIVFNLAFAIWASGAPSDEVVALFRAAIELDPTNQRAWRHLASALGDAGELPAAILAISQALAHSADDAETLQVAARLHLDAGDLEGAARLAEKCVAAAPTSPEGWSLKGTIALFALDSAAAWKSLRQAVDLAPQDADARVSLAQATLMQGRPRQARSLLDAALAIEPGNDTALCMLGWACLADDDMAAAVPAFARATIEDPSNPDGWAGTALVALAAGNAAGARSAVERALALEPQHVMASLILARLHETSEQSSQAKDLVDATLASSGTGPLPANLRDLLGSAPARKIIQRQQRRMAKPARADARNH